MSKDNQTPDDQTQRDPRNAANENDSQDNELANKGGVHLKDRSQRSKLPPLDFSGFIIGFGQTIQVALGLIPNPETGRQQVDLVVAEQFIDILDLLKEKTKNNLSKEEDSLLNALLFELKMQFYEAQNKNDA